MKFLTLFSLFRTAFFFALIAISIAGFSQHEGHGGGGTYTPSIKKTDNYRYVCPMHPGILSDDSGNCVKCGMKLERKKIAESKLVKRIYYNCPDHPSYQSDKKGKCSICGRKLKKSKEFFYELLEASNWKFPMPVSPLILYNKPNSVTFIISKHLSSKNNQTNKLRKTT